MVVCKLMASYLSTQSIQLQEGDQNLLRDALRQWYDHAMFTDDHVVQVKQVFKRVFGLPHDIVLAGSALPDAIVLQSSANQKKFYAIVQGENESDGWEAMELESDGYITFFKEVPFRLVLRLLEDSTGGLNGTEKNCE